RINGVFIGLLFGGQAWISRGVDHLSAELGEVQPTVMCSVPRVYEKMYAAVMSRVRESPGYRQRLFHWALNVGRQHHVEMKSGALLNAQYALADRLVLAALRKRLTGGRLRFFISGGAALSGDIEEIDGDGFLKITDRKKALFKTAVGKYIAPQPIEFGLTQDPLIDRALVIGESRPYVTALIVPDSAAAKQQGLDEAALRAHI